MTVPKSLIAPWDWVAFMSRSKKWIGVSSDNLRKTLMWTVQHWDESLTYTKQVCASTVCQEQPWPEGKSLNRLQARVGKSKDSLRKWGFLWKILWVNMENNNPSFISYGAYHMYGGKPHPGKRKCCRLRPILDKCYLVLILFLLYTFYMCYISMTYLCLFYLLHVECL